MKVTNFEKVQELMKQRNDYLRLLNHLKKDKFLEKDQLAQICWGSSTVKSSFNSGFKFEFEFDLNFPFDRIKDFLLNAINTDLEITNQQLAELGVELEKEK